MVRTHGNLRHGKVSIMKYASLKLITWEVDSGCVRHQDLNEQLWTSVVLAWCSLREWWLGVDLATVVKTWAGKVPTMFSRFCLGVTVANPVETFASQLASQLFSKLLTTTLENSVIDQGTVSAIPKRSCPCRAASTKYSSCYNPAHSSTPSMCISSN